MVLYGWESNPYAECTIRALLSRGIEIDFVTRSSSPWSFKEESCHVHPIFPGHRKGRPRLAMIVRELVAIARVARLLARRKPDIIHYQSYRMVRVDWLLFVLLRLLRKRVVFTIHDTHSLEASALDSMIFSQTARRADALLVHNRESKRVVEEKWGVLNSRVHLIVHGGYDQYYSVGQSRPEARQRLGLSPTDFVLLVFGSIRKYKGLDYLLPALVDVRRNAPELRVIVAGRAFDKALGESYVRMTSTLGLESTVEFRNRFIETREVEDLFTACDLVVLPYVRIDQSGVLFLAYTFGRPVLATRVGGLPELVRDGESGFLVAPADSQALCAGVTRAWNEKSRLPEMGARARRLIDEEYTWERQAETTIAAYRQLLGRS